MLRIKSLEIPIGDVYASYFGTTGPGLNAVILEGNGVDLVEPSIRRIHGPGYLKQGREFDSLGNKEVIHKHFDGTVFATPVINGISPSVEDYEGWTLVREDSSSLPVTYDIGQKRPRYAVQYAPLIRGGYKNTGGNYGHVVCYGALDAISINGVFQPVICSISITIRFGYAWSTTASSNHWPSGLTQAAFQNECKQAWSASKWTEGDGEPALVNLISRYLHLLLAYTRLGTAEYWSHRPVPERKPNLKIISSGVEGSYSTLFSAMEYYGLGIERIKRAMWSESELSSLSRSLIEQLNSFDGNLIAYASDLKSAGDTLKSTLSLVGDIKSPKKWASAWLSLRYGDRLTISDTKKLLRATEKVLRRSAPCQARWTETKTRQLPDGQLISVTRSSHVVAANESYSSLMTAIHNLMKWDAWPTLENTWDFIPFSFVVDWFLPVSDILGQIDAAVERPYIKTLSEYISERVTMSVDLRDTGFSGQVEAVYYVRRQYPVLNDIRPFGDVSSLPSFSVVNTGDALSLLVQTV